MHFLRWQNRIKIKGSGEYRLSPESFTFFVIFILSVFHSFSFVYNSTLSVKNSRPKINRSKFQSVKILVQLYLYRRRTNRLDDQFISDDQFDCINTKTHKSVDILCRRLIRQYKHETERIFQYTIPSTEYFNLRVDQTVELRR